MGSVPGKDRVCFLPPSLQRVGMTSIGHFPKRAGSAPRISERGSVLGPLHVENGMTESTITLYHQTSKRKAEEILLDRFTDCEDSKWFDIDGSVIEGIWLRRWPDPEKDYVADCEEGNVLFEIQLNMNEMELATYQVREDQWPHTTPLPDGIAGRSYVLPAVIVNSHLASLRVLALVQDASGDGELG